MSKQLYVILILVHHCFSLKQVLTQDKPRVVHVQLGLFMDRALVEHLEKQLGCLGADIGDLAAAYVEQVNTVFLGLRSKSRRVQVSLARLQLEPKLESYFDGDIDQLLSGFCILQSNGRRSGHWHLGLLLTSLDLFSSEESSASSEEQSRSTLGISPVGGVHWSDLSCALVEFRSNLSTCSAPAGAGSVYVAAHEIAHNLGISHDVGQATGSDGSPCWENSIMSPVAAAGESQPTRLGWSQCSIEQLENLKQLDELNKWTSSMVL